MNTTNLSDPRRRPSGRIFWLAIFANAVVSCGGGCAGAPETIVTAIDHPRPAKIVLRKERRFTDRGSYDAEFYSIVIDRSPKINFMLGCDTGRQKAPELSLDPKAERVGYRCGKEEPWTIYFLGAKSARLFNLCRTVVNLAWESIPSFEDERAGLLECATVDGPFANRFADTWKESRDRAGDDGVASYLIQTLTMDVRGVVDASGKDEWDAAWTALPASARRTRAALLRAVLKPGGSVFGIQRAMKHTDLSGVNPGELAAVAEYLSGLPDTDDFRANGARKSGLEIALRALASRDLPTAARISCKSAEIFSANGKSVILPRIELALIAAAAVSCRIDGVLDRNRCDLTFACCHRGFTCADSLRHSCSDAELAALVRLELAEPAQNPWKNGGGHGYELLAAAARVQKSEAATRFLQRIAPAPNCPK